MSGYDKNPNSYVDDYEQDTRSSTHNPRLPLPSYGQTTTPSYVPHTSFTPSSQASETHGISVPNELPLLSGQYTSRDISAYQTPSAGTFIEDRSRVSPDIISTLPLQADSAGRLRILLRSLTDYSAERYSFFVSFDYTKCQAVLTKDFVQTPYHHFVLTVDVPRFETQTLGGAGPRISSTMALLLEIQDENHLPLDSKSLGSFIYHPQPIIQRKRKHTEETPDYLQVKRTASQPLHASKYKDSSSVYSGPSTAMLPAVSTYAGALYTVPTSYDRPVHSRAVYNSQTISHRTSYYPSLSPNLTPASMRVRRSPTTQHYGSSHLTHSQSPRIASQQHSAAAMAPPVSPLSNPPLVRTSTMKAPRANQYNPYEMYPPNTKVTLKIDGSLSSVPENWTREEKLAARRLVEFGVQRQHGDIRTSFKTVTADTRNVNLTVVSCIYWQRKKQHYVTSVEIIVLLESILGIRFTVEEKNRIRRNLEGFKPLTVAKASDEHADIFKLIMGFPNPKPRNIEKDLKIFTWVTLENALKKIVSKYSPDYSSTIGMRPPSAGTVYHGNTMPESAEQHLSTASPGSSAVSSVATSYQTGLTSAAMSPSLVVAGSGALDLTSGGVHQQSLPLPHVAGGAHGDLRTAATPGMYPSGGAHMSPWNTAPYPSHYGAASRGTWDMGYLDQGAASTAAGLASAGAAQPSTGLAYYRSDEDNDRQDDPRYSGHQTSSRPQN